MTSSELHTYDAETAPRGMVRHILPIVGFPSVIARNTTLLANFFRRDLLGRFRGSLLGIFWVLIQPVFLFALYFFVFGFLFQHKVSEGGPNVEFALYLFSGIIAFSAFTDSTTKSCSTVLDNGNLVKKVAFPSELLPIPNILVSLIVYLVGAVVFVVVGLVTGVVQPSASMVAWPLVLVVHATMTLGVGFLLACLQVLIRDTAHLYGIASMAWFFLTPVFWPHRMLEEKMGDSAWLLQLNPMYPMIQAHRQSLGYVSPTEGLMRLVDGSPLPGVWYHLGCAAIWAVVFLVVGYSFFTSRKNKFSDLV